MVKSLRQNTRYTVHFIAVCGTDTLGDLFLEHSRKERYSASVVEYFEEYLGRDIVREIADYAEGLTVEYSVEVEFEEIVSEDSQLRIVLTEIGTTLLVYLYCEQIRIIFFQEKLCQCTCAGTDFQNIFNIVGNSFRYSFGNPEIFEEMLTEILFGCYSLH